MFAVCCCCCWCFCWRWTFVSALACLLLLLPLTLMFWLMLMFLLAAVEGVLVVLWRWLLLVVVGVCSSCVRCVEALRAASQKLEEEGHCSTDMRTASPSSQKHTAVLCTSNTPGTCARRHFPRSPLAVNFLYAPPLLNPQV